MARATDRNYLLRNQYKNAANLDARIAIHLHFSTNRYGWHRWMFDQLDLPAHANVLEIGCGPGTLWSKNKDCIPANWAVTLTDFSAGILEDARTRLTEINHELSLQVADAQALPFPDESFDAVISNHMLYHVPDRPKALSEIRRVLRAGGRLFAATNGQDHMKELMDMRLEALIRDAAGTDIDADDAVPASHGFTLENGLHQLEPWFRSTCIKLYEDGLRVTEAQAVVDYIASCIPHPLSENTLRTLTQKVQRQIDSRGAFPITKSVGLFVASKD